MVSRGNRAAAAAECHVCSGVRSVQVREINIPAATAALHLLGKQQGMFKDQVEHSGPDGGAILTRRVEYPEAGGGENGCSK